MSGGLLLLALFWVGYFVLHSLLASLSIKHWVSQRAPTLLPAYRLAFNLLSLVLLLPIGLLVWHLDGAPLWRWEGNWAWIANGLALTALGGFLWTLGYYQGMDFLGLSQWRANIQQVEDTERLCLSPLHRIVRHPWYFLTLLFIWSRDMPPATLLSVLVITIYLVVGSRLEEKKLVQRFGDAYRRYQQRVPALLPLPGRMLSREEAASIAAEANHRDS